VRLIRLAQQQARVSDDIRAALASLGRGNTVVGGVALVGVQVPGTTQPVDAVLLLPRGVLIVVGVDLPDPAMRLEAPLGGQWKADGWPLVRTDGTTNPATEALALSGQAARQLHDHLPPGLPLGTIVAVGPYVESVDQPPADLASTIRVLHPTPTSMLAAAVSLAAAQTPCTVTQLRALLGALAPEATVPSEAALTAEGFSGAAPRPVEEHPLAAVPATVPADHPPVGGAAEPAAQVVTAPAPVPAPGPVEPSPAGRAPASLPAMNRTAAAPTTAHPLQAVPAQPPAAFPAAAPGTRPMQRMPLSRSRPGAVRWLPVGALALIGALLVTAVVVALSTDGANTSADTPAAAAPLPGSGADGVRFTSVTSAVDQRCAPHVTGDMQASLQSTECTRLQRASFAVEAEGRAAAASVAVLTFSGPGQAEAFKDTADTPGSGAVADLAVESGQWRGTVPAFHGSAYASSRQGNQVRLVLACWLDAPSAPDDLALVRIASRALTVPMPPA
jgi:hypothetical protein